MAEEKNKMAKDLNRHPTKEDIPMEKCIWKDIQHHMSLEKCKLKRDTARLLTEWPKSRALTTPNVDEGVEQQELSFFAGGNGTWFSHFGRQFDSFLWNWTYSYQYNPAISVLPKWTESFHLHKSLHLDVQSSFSHNLQNLKANKSPSEGDWINELWNIHTIGYYLREFPDSPVVTTPFSHWCEPVPGPGSKTPTSCAAKNKK